MVYYSAIKNNDKRIFEDKCVELQKNHPEYSKPDSGKQAYVFIQKLILMVYTRS